MRRGTDLWCVLFFRTGLAATGLGPNATRLTIHPLILMAIVLLTWMIDDLCHGVF